MRIEIHLDSHENYTNIGLAKALIESSLCSKDLKEIAEYLLIFNDNHPTEKGGAEE